MTEENKKIEKKQKNPKKVQTKKEKDNETSRTR